MPVLQDQRYQEIAQWVTATTVTKSIAQEWKFRLSDAGFTVDELQRYGSAFTHDAYVMAYLVSKGSINSREANAFLAQKYPDLKYGGERFGDVRGGSAAEDAIAAGARPTSDPDRKTSAQSARDSQVKAGIGSFQSNPDFGPGVQYSIRAPKVPDEYDPALFGESLRAIAEQTSLALTSLANGNIRLQPNSVPGYVLQPGSVQTEKFDPISVSRMYRDLPGPESAIQLRLAPDYSTDRAISFSDGTTVDDSRRGPGRVWRVVDARFPANFTPTPGPQRYRLVFRDVRLGVFSLLQASAFGSGDVSVRYGIVVRDIPHYLGRVPSAILYTGFVGDAPCAQVADNINVATGGGQVTKLFHGTGTQAGRAYDRFVTNASLAFEPYGSGQLAPTAAELANVEGINFMLVSGRTAEEVYAQMNSAHSTNYARINGDARGPTASSPPGTSMDSPFPASFVRRSAATSISALESDAMTTTGRGLQWLEGLPMDFDSCQRLRVTDTFFSVCVQPAFVKTIPFSFYSGGGNVESAALWDTLGIRTTETNGRDLAVDLVVI